jgi:hypothetical protein
MHIAKLFDTNLVTYFEIFSAWKSEACIQNENYSKKVLLIAVFQGNLYVSCI